MDILLTDLKPVEVSKMYTVKNFYEYLSTKKKKMNKLVGELKNNITKDKCIFKSGWHVAPLKFNVYKDSGELRTLSIMNPISMIEVYLFVSIYNKNLLLYLENNDFSIRYHTKNNNLYYKKAYKGVVEYEYLQDDDKKAEYGLEASGTFYSIKPFDRLTKFYKSDIWFNLNNRFSYFAKIDYQSCFDSIYTHTYNWTITNNVVDAKNFKNNHVLSVIDRLLQNMNASITNGIIVGPEFSRLLAEIMLQHIDEEVVKDLVIRGKFQGEDYKVCRYVDDIFIFAKTEDAVQLIIDMFKEHSRKYHLKLNEGKMFFSKLPYIWNSWIQDVRYYINTIFVDTVFYKNQKDINYVVKGGNICKQSVMANIKEEFNILISKNYQYRNKIVSFALTVVFNKLTKKNKMYIFSKEIKDRSINRFLDILFYFYSFAPTYNNTQKLISVLYVVEKEIGEYKNKKILYDIVQNYDFIFINNNLDDIIDYLLLISNYKIELRNNIEIHIISELEKRNNPILYAVYLMYSRYSDKYFNIIKNMVNEKIIEDISMIYSDKNIFLYDEIWWIIVFWQCPYVECNIQDKLHEKLDLISNENTLSYKCRKIIYDFLEDDSFPNKFINWNIERCEFFETTVFNTYERTLFNNNFDSEYYVEDY